MYTRMTAAFSTLSVGKYLLGALLCLLIAALAACGGGAGAPPAASPPASGSGDSGSDSAAMMVDEPEFKIQLVCINRTGNPCTLIYSTQEEHGIDGFIERVKDRTNGRVEFQISSFPELGLAGPDSLRLIGDQTMELAEIYSGYIGGDLPIIDVANLWGLFPDSATNFAVIDATRSDLHRIIEEQSNGRRHYGELLRKQLLLLLQRTQHPLRL